MLRFKRPRLSTRIKSLSLAALLIGSQLAVTVPVSAVQVDPVVPTTTTVNWEGNGSENATPTCAPGQTPLWHWILTPGGNTTLVSGSLDVDYQSGATTTTAGTFPGNGNGAMHFNVTRPATDTVTAASVTFDYTGNPGNFVLTISHFECQGTPTATTGSVKVNKQVDADGDGVFEGSNSEASQLGFLWGLDSTTPANAMGATVSGVSTGAHTVTENNVTGYEFAGWYTTSNTSKSCTNPQGTTLPVAINVVNNQTRQITLCNKKKAAEQTPNGSLTIKKMTDPDHRADDFSFATTGDGLHNFQLDRELDNATLSDTKVFSNLTAGTYTVTEQSLAIWELDKIECDTETGIQTNGATLTVNLSAGQDVTCTFYNKKKTEHVKPAKLTIIKDADPSDEQDFQFTTIGEGLTDFTLDDDNDEDDTYKDRISFTQLMPGEYTITESEVEGWTLDDIDCDDIEDDQVWVDEASRTLKVTLKAADDVECTFDNNKDGGGGGELPVVKGTIRGVKFNDLDGDGLHDENEVTLPNWGITLYFDDDDEDTLLNNTKYVTTDQNGAYSFLDLPKGDYIVCETQQGDWTQTFPTANGGCHKFTVNTNGQVCIANFGNEKKPGQVLGEVTSEKPAVVTVDVPAGEVKALVDTGSSASIAVFAALAIIGVVGAVSFASLRKYSVS